MDVEFRRPRLPEVKPVDDELIQRIVDRLHKRLGSSLSDFQMLSREDGLILHGQVTSYYYKQLTQELVMNESGLSILANDIEVQNTDWALDAGANKDEFT